MSKSKSEGNEFFERRQFLRTLISGKLKFNILKRPEDYERQGFGLLSELSAMDMERPINSPGEEQGVLDRIDRKLSILIQMLAQSHLSKDYPLVASAYDISEEGLSFIYAGPELPLNATVELILSLPGPEGGQLDILARVNWLLPLKPRLPESSELEIFYGLEFIDILESDQKRIVQWIFKKQRYEIRKQRNACELKGKSKL